ncbi:hypothetical protein DVS28_a1918 [Euzebya pacifica]|uniref:DUF892 family protein n=1 Tax=Euzebya pacifica TaxID=1608957 RepID=A0A346XWK6_9ACTN|nr:hypothetical protein [Euzebya pacifica]AXV06603.1 hypothetical protein DVS28_a1918 [Euzebya pacifica]
MPLDIDSLTEYLNDHLGGAAGATDLLRRRLDEGRGNDELAELLAGIETHRTHLEELMAELGISHSVVRQTVGWVGERMAQLKLKGEALRDDGVRDLLELESLSIGVHGKQRLWLALAEIRGTHPALEALDLEWLIASGEEQQATVERHRLAAVRRAFANADG